MAGTPWPGLGVLQLTLAFSSLMLEAQLSTGAGGEGLWEVCVGVCVLEAAVGWA